MIESITYAEVRNFLSKTRGSYRRLLDAIVGELEDFRDRGANRDRIYRIYTRADKQIGGDALKSEAGIAGKLQRWRNQEQEGRTWRVPDIHDIIGLTVVTYFDSDVAQIVGFLQKDTFKSFKVIGCERKGDRGYYAHHLTVEGRGAGRSQLKCEIQVKTLLNDGWAAKTHDFTYKARQAIAPEVEALVQSIGTIVQTLEQQSDSLRELILGNLERDRERRSSAVKHLMLVQTTNYPADSDAELATLFGSLDKHLGHVGDCSEVDPILLDMVEQWHTQVRTAGASRGRSRFIVALAALRADHDLDSVALSAVDQYEETALASGQEIEQERALGFKPLAYWVLGDIDAAEASGDRYIDWLEKRGRATASAYLDLAYYIAERSYLTGGDALPDDIAKIEALVSRAPPPSNERSAESARDTCGAIKIMTGTDVQTISSGMEMCEKAYAWAKATKTDVKLFRLFHGLHTQRAKRQLVKLAGM